MDTSMPDSRDVPQAAGAEPADVDCRQIVDLLADYLDGSLPRRTAELLEWHIDGCSPCVAFVNTYRGTVEATRRLRDTEIPTELKNRLRAFLREHPPR
jgi:hypothetical protein